MSDLLLLLLSSLAEHSLLLDLDLVHPSMRGVVNEWETKRSVFIPPPPAACMEGGGEGSSGRHCDDCFHRRARADGRLRCLLVREWSLESEDSPHHLPQLW